jgi:hypothetical protein
MLPRILTLTLSWLLTAAFALANAQVYRFGSLAETLTDEAVAAMARAAGPFWAVYGVSHPISDQGKATLFMTPTVVTPRLRRGAARTVRCASSVNLGSCLKWAVSGRDLVYVQVAHKEPFGQERWPRSVQERPILLECRLPDDDVVALVDYLRSKPEGEHDSGFRSGMFEDDPVLSIRRGTSGLFTVMLSSDGIGGSRATLRKRSGKWHLVKVGAWVS